MTDDELEEELPPACGKAAGPLGQFTALHRAEQAARLVRPVDDYGDAEFLREGEQAPIRFALGQ